jgi:hypothetical protein
VALEVLGGLLEHGEPRVLQPSLDGRREPWVDFEADQAGVVAEPLQDLGGVRARPGPELDDEPRRAQVGHVEHVRHRSPRRRQDRTHLPGVGQERPQEQRPLERTVTQGGSPGVRADDGQPRAARPRMRPGSSACTTVAA